MLYFLHCFADFAFLVLYAGTEADICRVTDGAYTSCTLNTLNYNLYKTYKSEHGHNIRQTTPTINTDYRISIL